MTEVQQLTASLFGKDLRPCTEVICDLLRGEPTAVLLRKWSGHKLALEYIRFERGE